MDLIGETKSCAKCLIEKDLCQFGRDVNCSDGKNVYCKECIRKRSKLQKIKVGDKYKPYYEKYREENREIIREKARVDYYLNYEKRKQQSKKSYEKHKKEIAEKRSERSRLQEVREYNRVIQKEWRKRNASRNAETVSNWKKRNPQQAACHSTVLWAVKSGILIRPSKCLECNIECKPHAHHEDYNKPLEVIWICRSCHGKKHRIYR